jgi:hypothetical protein
MFVNGYAPAKTLAITVAHLFSVRAPVVDAEWPLSVSRRPF